MRILMIMLWPWERWFLIESWKLKTKDQNQKKHRNLGITITAGFFK